LIKDGACVALGGNFLEHREDSFGGDKFRFIDNMSSSANCFFPWGCFSAVSRKINPRPKSGPERAVFM